MYRAPCTLVGRDSTPWRTCPLGTLGLAFPAIAAELCDAPRTLSLGPAPCPWFLEALLMRWDLADPWTFLGFSSLWTTTYVDFWLQDLKDFARQSSLDVVYSETGRDSNGRG